MSHILIGLALCAGLLIYPGGVTLVGLSVLLASGASWWRSPRSWAWADAGPSFVPLLLASLVVIPLPWPGSPLVGLDVAGLGRVGVGGVALSAMGLLGLDLLAPALGPDRWIRLLWSGLSVTAILVLAELVSAADWSSLLGASGVGAEGGRLLAGGLCLLAAPWTAGSQPELRLCSASAWTARVCVATFLVLPQLQQAPVWPALGAVLLACLAVGITSGVGRRFRPQLGGRGG
ncbi:MAG: hypothetical protein ACYCYK_11000 [Candidatus Dormibacteria bacterium]